MNENQIFNELREKDSPYYAGTACLLSLLPVINVMEKEIPYQADAYNDLKKNIQNLMRDDGIYYSMSLKKEPLSEQEWKKVLSITQEYEEVLSILNELMYLLKSINSQIYLSLIKEKFLILAKLCQLSLAQFYEMENQPEEFFQFANMALLAIRGEDYEEL